MKERCKEVFEEPGKWRKWKSRIIYLIVADTCLRNNDTLFKTITLKQ